MRDRLDQVGQRGMSVRILLFLLMWEDVNVGGIVLWFGALDHTKSRES